MKWWHVILELPMVSLGTPRPLFTPMRRVWQWIRESPSPGQVDAQSMCPTRPSNCSGRRGRGGYQPDTLSWEGGALTDTLCQEWGFTRYIVDPYTHMGVNKGLRGWGQFKIQRHSVLVRKRDVLPKKFDFPGFEGHTELFDPHPFTWKTPTPPENSRTQKFGFVPFFRVWIMAWFYTFFGALCAFPRLFTPPKVRCANTQPFLFNKLGPFQAGNVRKLIGLLGLHRSQELTSRCQFFAEVNFCNPSNPSIPVSPHGLGRTPRGSCNNTLLRRVLRRFSRLLSRRF